MPFPLGMAPANTPAALLAKSWYLPFTEEETEGQRGTVRGWGAAPGHGARGDRKKGGRR